MLNMSPIVKYYGSVNAIITDDKNFIHQYLSFSEGLDKTKFFHFAVESFAFDA
jgi:hypothetical protein